MNDPTEGLELVEDEALGRFYTVSDLHELAQRAAEGRQIDVGEVEEYRQFYVFRKDDAAHLLIEVDTTFAARGGTIKRTLSTQGAARKLELVCLGVGAAGKPTASINRQLLTEDELMQELVRPLIADDKNNIT